MKTLTAFIFLIGLGGCTKERAYTFQDCFKAFNPDVPVEDRLIFVGRDVGSLVLHPGQWKGIACFRHNVQVFKICDALMKNKREVPLSWIFDKYPPLEEEKSER